MSEHVVQEAKEVFDFRELDTIRVKGKTQGIKIYELLGETGTKTADHKKYETALTYYYS